MVSPVNSLQAKFLEELTEDIFSTRGSSEAQKLCFKFRFYPHNFCDKHERIAFQINEKLNNSFEKESINKTVSDVVEKLRRQFEDQMRTDGVAVELLKPGEKGNPGDKKSPWQIIYKWLWEKEFPRRGWQLARNMAIYGDEQLQMQPLVQLALNSDSRNLDLFDIPVACDNSIKKGREYRLQFNLQQPGYLLLINQGVTGEKYGICPSRAYNPDGQLLPDIPMAVPNDKGLVKFLRYNAAGDEYFLAIVTEQPLNLSWVRPDSAPRDIVVDEGRLYEIFEQVGQLPNCQAFYKTFQVVD